MNDITEKSIKIINLCLYFKSFLAVVLTILIFFVLLFSREKIELCVPNLGLAVILLLFNLTVDYYPFFTEELLNTVLSRYMLQIIRLFDFPFVFICWKLIDLLTELFIDKTYFSLEKNKSARRFSLLFLSLFFLVQINPNGLEIFNLTKFERFITLLIMSIGEYISVNDLYGNCKIDWKKMFKKKKNEIFKLSNLKNAAIHCGIICVLILIYIYFQDSLTLKCLSLNYFKHYITVLQFSLSYPIIIFFILVIEYRRFNKNYSVIGNDKISPEKKTEFIVG